MVRFAGGLLLFSTFSSAAPPDKSPDYLPSQHIIQNPLDAAVAEPRKLKGRFLHITDVHPDPFYKVHSSPDSEHPCHPGSGPGPAGYYGAEVTDCDAPFSLVNATFQWIEENLKDEIDFVVWTGDSARHDNDEQYPRKDSQVIDLNKFVVNKFVEVFGKTDNIDDPDPTNDFIIPIVPTFGNNDILPHNILEPGPNKWTRDYEEIWKKFIPQEQKHSFARGGWFFSEVIPNRLAVFSLNTLYFFDSNSAVDGCDLESEPGYEHMEWLRIQLQFLRQRGMKALLIGHVPPARTESKQSWDESCYQKYTLWLRQYRDVVVSSIFGHMNIDHFMFQDVKELAYKFKIEGVDNEFSRTSGFKARSNNEKFTTAAKATYLNELRDGWSTLPSPPRGSSYTRPDMEDASDGFHADAKKKKSKKQKKLEKFLKDIGGPWGERFSLSLVSPSVVPNYYPTIRVVEYNITGLEKDHPAIKAIGKPADVRDIHPKDNVEGDEEHQAEPTVGAADEPLHELKKKKKKGKKKPPKKPPFPVPHPPSSTAVPGPAYSPQPLSLLSWTQYYANITKMNEDVKSKGFEVNTKPEHKHFKYHVEYTTNNDSVYMMKDLTVRKLLDIAERVGRSSLPKTLEQRVETESVEVAVEYEDVIEAQKGRREKKKKGKKEKGTTGPKNHLWRTFVKRAFVHTKPEEDLDDQFG